MPTVIRPAVQIALFTLWCIGLLVLMMLKGVCELGSWLMNTLWYGTFRATAYLSLLYFILPPLRTFILSGALPELEGMSDLFVAIIGYYLLVRISHLDIPSDLGVSDQLLGLWDDLRPNGL